MVAGLRRSGWVAAAGLVQPGGGGTEKLRAGAVMCAGGGAPRPAAAALFPLLLRPGHVRREGGPYPAPRPAPSPPPTVTYAR